MNSTRARVCRSFFLPLSKYTAVCKLKYDAVFLIKPKIKYGFLTEEILTDKNWNLPYS